MLKQFDGSDPEKPIYLAVSPPFTKNPFSLSLSPKNPLQFPLSHHALNLQIDGEVYDVTGGKAYQPGGSYSILYVQMPLF